MAAAEKRDETVSSPEFLLKTSPFVDGGCELLILIRTSEGISSSWHATAIEKTDLTFAADSKHFETLYRLTCVRARESFFRFLRHHGANLGTRKKRDLCGQIIALQMQENVKGKTSQ